MFALSELPGDLDCFDSCLPQIEHPLVALVPFEISQPEAWQSGLPSLPFLGGPFGEGQGEAEQSSQETFEGCLSFCGKNGRVENFQERNGKI